MKLRLAGMIVCLCCSSLWADEIKVLNESIVSQPGEMLSEWLNKDVNRAFADWQERYEALKTPEQIAAYQQQLRASFLKSLGDFPERTPLHPRVTGIVPRDGYRVEKVLFESQPKHYVTGLCFVPDSTRFKAPYPGVLVVCGHSANGKGYEKYQAVGALLALNGMVGFVVDPICQGERYEHLKEDGSIQVTGTTDGHSLLGAGSILLGQNTARYEIWDGMRGIDYLQQRDDVDPQKIGCMGNSGGGTQTSYLMALDERIQAAAPACYLTDFASLLSKMGPQDAEQNIFGQLAWGMDHADYVMMRAPVPVLICTATKDMFPIDGSWSTYRKAKRLFTRLGFPERVDLVEADGPHGWHTPLREGGVRWMSRWLAGRDVDVREPAIQPLSEKEFQVTERGQTLLIPGAKSAFDFNREEYEALQSERAAAWKSPDSAREQVRQLVGIQSLAEIKEVPAQSLGESTMGSIKIERWALQPEPGITLPALLYRPAAATQGPLIYLHADGKQAAFPGSEGPCSALGYAEQGHTVLAVDLRGIGETFPEKGRWYNKRFGEEAKLVVLAYLLGKNFVGLRANDILASARWFMDHEQLPVDQRKLTLVAAGKLGVPALHAAAMESDLFQNVTLFQPLCSWETIIDSTISEGQYVNCIHGAARLYELHDLAGLLGDRIQILQPTNAMGEVVK